MGVSGHKIGVKKNCKAKKMREPVILPKIHFGKIQFGKLQFGKLQFRKNSLENTL